MNNVHLLELSARLARSNRIINNRIEKSIKGRRIGHTGERGRGLLCISTTVVMLAGLVLPWRTLRPPHPQPGVENRCGRRVRQRVWGGEESGVNLPSAKKFFIAAMLL